MLFVNFKTYKEGTGAQAVNLLQILNSVQAESGVPIVPVVQVADARLCVEASDNEVWVQHVDAAEYGQHTGWVLPEAVAAQGVRGTFLNHSEHKFPVSSDQLSVAVKRCREVGLGTAVFAADLGELEEVVGLKPDYIAYEPPELIASETTSVAKAKPDVIGKAAEVAKKAGIPLIVGAGVKDAEDVRTSLGLGAVGVAVSSAVVLARDPRKVLVELARGFE